MDKLHRDSIKMESKIRQVNNKNIRRKAGCPQANMKKNKVDGGNQKATREFEVMKSYSGK